MKGMKRGMGAATKGGGSCMPVKRATGTPPKGEYAEGATPDMLSWMGGVTSPMLGMVKKPPIPLKTTPKATKDYGADEGITPEMVEMLNRMRKSKKKLLAPKKRGNYGGMR